MADKPLIFSTHSLHPSITEQLEVIGNLQVASAPTPEAIDQESVGAEFIVVRAAIDPKIVEREKRLRALVRHGAGLDMIPVKACTACGVLVANVPGVNAQTVAEHAIWCALALRRRYPMVNRDLRNTGWESGRAHANHGLELTGKTIGIVGMGNVGNAIHKIARFGFDMKVHTVTGTRSHIPDDVANVELAELLASSDVVVLCCPLNEETRGLIGEAELRLMKPDAVLVNVSRGPVIDEAALINVLTNRRIRGAALDVFDSHPLPPGHALFGFENVILTPHMAGITSESMLRMGQGVVDEIARIIKGDIPVNFINPEALGLYNRRFSVSH